MHATRLSGHLCGAAGVLLVAAACGGAPAAPPPATPPATAVAELPSATAPATAAPAATDAPPTAAPVATAALPPSATPAPPSATPVPELPIPPGLVPATLDTALLDDLYRQASARAAEDVGEVSFGGISVTVHPFADPASRDGAPGVELTFLKGALVYGYAWSARTEELEFRGQIGQLIVVLGGVPACDRPPWEAEPAWQELIHYGYRTLGDRFPAAPASRYTLSALAWEGECDWHASFWDGETAIGDFRLELGAPRFVPTPAPTASPTAVAASGVVAIATTSDDLGFDTPTLSVQAGQRVELVFRNESAILPHSWVLVSGGDDVARRVAEAAVLDGTEDFLPPASPDVLAHTAMVDPGESDTISFTAPEPGTYVYLCSYPGHYELGMRGALVVGP